MMFDVERLSPRGKGKGECRRSRSRMAHREDDKSWIGCGAVDETPDGRSPSETMNIVGWKMRGYS
jgi:hypothetical protein